MKRLVFTPAARNDLREIWVYSARNWGLGQADDYTDAIEAACRSAAENSVYGLRVFAQGDYRKHVIRSYRDFPDRIEVIRILHVRQDPDTHLAE